MNLEKLKKEETTLSNKLQELDSKHREKRKPLAKRLNIVKTILRRENNKS